MNRAVVSMSTGISVSDPETSVRPLARLHAELVLRVIDSLRRTELRLGLLENHLRAAAIPWADVVSDVMEQVASDAWALEHLCQQHADS